VDRILVQFLILLPVCHLHPVVLRAWLQVHLAILHFLLEWLLLLPEKHPVAPLECQGKLLPRLLQ
jgi:hypothetical protein